MKLSELCSSGCSHCSSLGGEPFDCDVLCELDIMDEFIDLMFDGFVNCLDIKNKKGE